MKTSDLLINLVAMRQSGEFSPDEVLSNIGVRHGRSITVPVMGFIVYLDCEYREEDLPPYIRPYKFDSESFWG